MIEHCRTSLSKLVALNKIVVAWGLAMARICCLCSELVHRHDSGVEKEFAFRYTSALSPGVREAMFAKATFGFKHTARRGCVSLVLAGLCHTAGDRTAVLSVFPSEC